ncbi:hypothetical protein BpHYR1_008973 [Brachionus plicatilis]|uniref:Uncharacterized protein n=1 Tax=Brachionus plicatilis TaxID=10195 RepID=A0A3M7RWP4_BRAPC|nr:hypothetical protein BpHYR1_008973 [Brachionus plicatilis]
MNWMKDNFSTVFDCSCDLTIILDQMRIIQRQRNQRIGIAVVGDNADASDKLFYKNYKIKLDT